MKGFCWKYLLPSVMLMLALACHIYDPHEYRVRSLRDGVTSNLFYFGQHSPAWAGRISRGLNFPALVLAYPFRDATQTIYDSGDVDHILIMISPADVSFFIGIMFFWSCTGWIIDQRGASVFRSPVVSFVGLAGGIVFGLATGAYAAPMVASKWFPERIIGGFGILWAAVLIGYFGRRLIGDKKATRVRGGASPV